MAIADATSDVEPSPEEKMLRSEIKDRLLPMLCAARVGKQRIQAGDGKALVSLDSKGRIVIRSTPTTTSAFRLYRDYAFNDSEMKLAREFTLECLKLCE